MTINLKSLIPIIVLGLFLGLTDSSFSNNPEKRHTLWDEILNEFVDNSGMVNYAGIKKDPEKLMMYLSELSKNKPDNSWSDKQALAYWINAYNAFTIELIIQHYPLTSIKEIDNAWDRKFIEITGEKYSLNQIEHEIIRIQFDEPRIHFALVCAAISCPILLNEAYRAEKLDQQLQQQSMLFINDKTKNNISEKKARLSQLFNWFDKDFTKEGGLYEYINRFSSIKLTEKTKIEFMAYDWGLNDQRY